MKRILLILTMAINAFFCVIVHGQNVPTEQPQRVQHPYYQYDGFIEAKKGILLPRRIANFTPKSPVLIYDTVSGKVSVYFGGWKSFQNVAYTSDYNDLINRPDLTQYVPTSRTINGYSLTSNITINKVDIGLGNVQNVDVTNAGNITSGTLSDARLSANVTLQGNTFNGANQLLQLDAGGKVAYANLPASLMIYKGVWDASTNTPTLADGSGVNGWVYRVHPGGTVNFGSGNITFLSGDYVIYNGSVWQKSGGGDAVTSVNGQQGVVVLTTANIAEGGTNYYYTNTRVQTFGDTRYSLLNHEHVYSDIANLSTYTGFDVRYKSISYVPSWSEITGKPSFATVATSGSYTDLSGTPTLGSLSALSSIGNTYITDVAWSKVTGAPFFLTAENDPVYTASSWYSTTNNASNWNTAYSWGNYANRTLTINGTTYDLSANRSWTVGDVRTDGSYSNPSWINSIAWAKLTGIPSSFTPSAHTHPYSDLTGTVPTWNQNTTGNAATATTATNWGVVPNSLNSPAEASGLTNLIGVHSNTYAYKFTVGAVQSWLGLGSNAYTSTSFLPAAGGAYRTIYTRGEPTGLGVGFTNSSASSPHTWIMGAGSYNQSYQGWSIYDETTDVFPMRIFDNSDILFGRNVTIGSNNVSTLTVNGQGSGKIYLYGAYSGSPSNPGFVITNYDNVVTFSHNSNGGSTTTSGTMTASSFNGAGTGLTGTAIGLSVGGTSYGVQTTSLGSGTMNVNYSYSAVFRNESGTGGNIQYAPTLHASGGDTQWQLTGDYSSSTSLRWRGGYDGTWYPWREILHSANYYNYSPTLTGTGASGTWSISITGSAGSVAWTNVTSRPTSVSSFTNDAGYITSAVTSIAGTSNQIAVSAATGSVTVSLTNNVVIPGTITSSASYESSDRRLKRALSGTRLIGQIESLQARLYEKDGRDEYGYYAQDALKIIPTAVKQREDGYYDLSYTQVFVVKIASLEKRVAELETLLKKIYGK